MPAIIASNLAISASASSNREKTEAKTFNCTRTTESFDSKTATLEQKQKYAECVQHLHPIKTEQEVVLYKAASVLFLVSCLVSFIYMFETRRKAYCRDKIDFVLPPLLFGIGVMVAVVGLFAFAIRALFS